MSLLGGMLSCSSRIVFRMDKLSSALWSNTDQVAYPWNQDWLHKDICKWSKFYFWSFRNVRNVKSEDFANFGSLKVNKSQIPNFWTKIVDLQSAKLGTTRRERQWTGNLVIFFSLDLLIDTLVKKRSGLQSNKAASKLQQVLHSSVLPQATSMMYISKASLKVNDGNWQKSSRGKFGWAWGLKYACFDNTWDEASCSSFWLEN